MSQLMQIAKLIESVESTQDLHRLSQILKARYNTLQCLTGMTFRKDQKVSFTTKHGQTLMAVVVKVNTKSVDVKTSVGNYRVSPSMLKAA
jgi:hypothetical protein